MTNTTSQRKVLISAAAGIGLENMNSGIFHRLWHGGPLGHLENATKRSSKRCPSCCRSWTTRTPPPREWRWTRRSLRCLLPASRMTPRQTHPPSQTSPKKFSANTRDTPKRRPNKHPTPKICPSLSLTQGVCLSDHKRVPIIFSIRRSSRQCSNETTHNS